MPEELIHGIPLVGRKGGEADSGEPDNNGGQAPAGGEENNGGDGGGQGQGEFRVTIGGVEYTDPNELAKNYAGGYDAFQKATDENARLKQQLEQFNQKTPQKSEEEQLSEAEFKQRKQYLKDTYGLVDREDMQKEIGTALSTREVLANVRGFVKDHNGTDGQPKADFDEMIKFMDERRMIDPEEAYWLMNRDKIKESYARQALEQKPKPMYSERKGTGSEKVNTETKPVHYNDDEARAKRRAEIISRHI